jgi:NADPH oxidase
MLVEFQAPQLGLGSSFEIHFEQYAGATGHIMLFICFLMYTSVKRQVKTKNYEFFWYTHHLFVPFYICLFLHACGCFVKSVDLSTTPPTKVCKGYNSNYGTIPFFILYIFERLYRHYRASLSTQLTKVIFHPGNNVELRFEKDSFKYKPGQYLFLNIPEVSSLQWHPFTISSTPEEGFVSVHIRIVGDWTKKVAHLLGCFGKGEAGVKAPRIYVDGPFGAPAEDLYNYKAAILIGTGIGVTPAASLLKSVWYRYYRNAPMPLRKLYFFWINRDAEAFSWFQSLIASLEDTVPASQLEIHTYLTGNQSFDDIQNISMSHADTVDPITELKSRTHFGRPNWRSIFKAVQVFEKCQKGSIHESDGLLDIGVFYCGPSALAKVLAKECEHSSEGNVKFTLRKEHF